MQHAAHKNTSSNLYRNLTFYYTDMDTSCKYDIHGVGIVYSI